MNINNFFTLQSGLAVTEKNGPGKTAQPLKITEFNFMDLILTPMLQTQESGAPPVTIGSNTEQSGFNLAELIAATPEVEDHVKNFVTTGSANLTPHQQIMQTLSLNQKAFDDSIKPLTKGIITAEEVAKGSPRILEALLIETEKNPKAAVNRLNMILDKLDKLPQNKNGMGYAIANLTPEQITELKAKLTSLLGAESAGGQDAGIETSGTGEEQKAELEKELTNLMIGLVKILPPQAQPEVIVLPQGLIISPRALDVKSASHDPAKPANDLAARMNSLLAGNANIDAPAAGEDPADIVDAGEEEDFSGLLKQFSAKKNGLELNISPVKNMHPIVAMPRGTDFSLLHNGIFGAGSLTAPGTDFDSYGNPVALSSLSVTGLANAANLSIHAPSAGSAHPATHAVAALIQKGAADGANRSITVQLDPPELGRVEVRLNFGREKTVKAIIVTDHSDTMAMLQRDSHLLERTLQNAGLELDGTIGFQLAGDQQFSGGDGRHDGSSSGQDRDTSEAEDIIQSTMTWLVDSETGHIRYSILA